MKFRLLPRWAQWRKLGRIKFALVFSVTLTTAAWLGDLTFGARISPEKYLWRFLGWGLFATFMWRRLETSYKRYAETKKTD